MKKPPVSKPPPILAITGRKPETPRTGGREKGTQNKTTQEMKQAIAAFASANVEHMTTWLGQVQLPEKKIELMLRALEYYIPKLARSEVVGEDGGPVKLQMEAVEGLSDKDLEALNKLLAKAVAKK